MPASHAVRGEVVLPSAGIAAGTAEVTIQVEDVSRADAPSIVIGEQRMSGVAVGAGGVLPFTIEIPAGLVDGRRNYSVRAHISRSGSNEVSVGDLVSTQSYPVLTRGFGDRVRIVVKPV